MKVEQIWQPEKISRERDKLVGSEITQLTSAAMITQDIYCEERYTSVDGTRLACLRSIDGWNLGASLCVIDLPSGRVATLSDKIIGYPTSSLQSDDLYFVRPSAHSSMLLCKANLQTFEVDELFDLTKCPMHRFPICTVSPDGRWFISRNRVSKNVWGLFRVDLQRNTWNHFHSREDICNPHQQFNPADPTQIMVQHNRGCDIDDAGNIVKLVGEQGATLYTIDIEGNIQHDMPVGKPSTPPVTGHECWVGMTGKVILTTMGGQIHILKPGDKSTRLLWQGMPFNHIAASNDGKYFITDDFTNGVLYVGSIATGRMLPLCETGTSNQSPQYTHAHAYMTQGNKHVIFNSDRMGLCQVWSASVPDGYLAMLDTPNT